MNGNYDLPQINVVKILQLLEDASFNVFQRVARERHRLDVLQAFEVAFLGIDHCVGGNRQVGQVRQHEQLATVAEERNTHQAVVVQAEQLQVPKREILTDRSIPALGADAGVCGAVGVVIVQFQTVVVVIE